MPGSHIRIRATFMLPFLAGGIGIGAWASSLPVLADLHGLDKGELGNVLLYFALGAILLMVTVGRFNRRFDSSTLSMVGAVVFALALLAASLVEGDAPLAVAVFVAGAGFGVLDVSMNTSVSTIERLLDKHMMSSFHAIFSVGNLIAAFFVARILSGGGGLAACLGTAAVLILLLAVAGFVGAGRNRLSDPHEAARGPASARLERDQIPRLALLGAVGFFAFLAEGGMMDWSAVYLVSEIGTPESVAAYGFAIFATAMAAGRFFGDMVVARLGAVRFMVLCALICAASVAMLIASASVLPAFVALAVCGVSVGNIVPIVFAVAGKTGGRAAGQAMSIVTTMGYSGLLLGPAILGYVAQATSLQVSLGLIVGAFLLIVIGSAGLRRRA